MTSDSIVFGLLQSSLADVYLGPMPVKQPTMSVSVYFLMYVLCHCVTHWFAIFNFIK